jgi:hypothetical protein
MSCSKDDNSMSFLEKYNNTLWLDQYGDSYYFNTGYVIKFIFGNYCTTLNEGSFNVDYDGESFSQTTKILKNSNDNFSFSQEASGYITRFDFMVLGDDLNIKLYCNNELDDSVNATISKEELSNTSCIENQYVGC